MQGAGLSDQNLDIGMSRAEFLEFMQSFNSNYGQFRVGYTVLKENDYDRLFDVFAGSYHQSMDFRLFLCCLSLLIRGHIKDKLDLYF